MGGGVLFLSKYTTDINIDISLMFRTQYTVPLTSLMRNAIMVCETLPPEGIYTSFVYNDTSFVYNDTSFVYNDTSFVYNDTSFVYSDTSFVYNDTSFV
jgi:hypothetical protein